MTLALPEPSFIARDPATIHNEVIADFEQRSGRTLRPAQVERLLCKSFSYRETLVRQDVQRAALQNLLAYATGEKLDWLGDLLKVPRLGPTAARTTLQFELEEPLGVPLVIVEATRIRSRDGKLIFRPIQPLTIPAAETTGTVIGEAETTGVEGNGYLPGDVTTLVDPIAGMASVANTTRSSGGAPAEEDDPYRLRIQEAPERFTVAGSSGAYRFHAMSAHASIIDVSVASTLPGTVQLYVLTSSGEPSEELLALVVAAVSDERVRPLTDLVTVAGPSVIEFTLETSLTLYTSADLAAVQLEAERRITIYRAWMQSRLGRDIVPSQLQAALQSIPGVYLAEVISPATAQVLTADQWGQCTDSTLNMLGYVDG